MLLRVVLPVGVAIIPAAMSAVFVFWGCLMSHVMNTYARLPVAFSHGQGSRITDTEGKEYLDALSGIAVSTLGHAHPKLVAAIAAQAGRVLHTSNLYGIPTQDKLSDRLAALSGMQEIFLNYKAQSIIWLAQSAR